MPEREVVRLGIQLAEGLGTAHAEGKPGNVMITPDGRLKILDFGLAKLLRPVDEALSTETLGVRIIGTLPYMAPE